MTGSIVRTIVGLLLLQALFFGVVCRYAAVPLRVYVQFLWVTIIVHGVLLAALVGMRPDFILMSSGQPLPRVNVAIRVTLLRTSSIPTMIFLLNLVERYRIGIIAIVALSFICITDLIDGKLARNLRQETRIGQYLDSTSDYGLLVAITIVFNFYGLISGWFFLLVLLRLTLQLCGIAGVMLFRHVRAEVRPTLLGKCCIGALMVLYSFSLLALLPSSRGTVISIRIVLEYVVGLFLVASLLERTLLLVGHFREAGRMSTKE